ncbi:hypothetical protein Noc_0434 [Nitrosococcus oceani ATCC 19707]|uniref:Uncharacterized protein n=2 Tax=Nitrosococcus oceani TaxID=1229 RepID=Q3JDY8_NITOC|nr:hypothetical protein Noc_0434 [Nitrosococcus oceani ATCC 19707]
MISKPEESCQVRRPVRRCGVNALMNIHKKIVVDEQGNPQEVIIPWDEFQELAEILGLDLDSEDLEDLRQAREDRESGKRDAYIDLDSI